MHAHAHGETVREVIDARLVQFIACTSSWTMGSSARIGTVEMARLFFIAPEARMQPVSNVHATST